MERRETTRASDGMGPTGRIARVIAALLALTLAACGGLGAGRGNGAPPPITSAGTGTTVADAPRRGGRATIGVVGTPATLNPAFDRTGLAAVLFRPVVEGLFETDERGGVRARLAEGVPGRGGGVSEDGLVVILRLRQGVAWEDNRSFTAADVFFTHAATLDPANPVPPEVAAAGRTIRALDALDPYTVRLSLDAPGDAWMRAFPTILPAHLFNGRTDLAGHPYGRAPFGTGPFRLREWVPGDRLVLARSASYRRGDRPYLDEIAFLFFPDSAAAEGAMRARAIDLLLTPDAGGFLAPEGRDTGLRGVAPVPGLPPTWNAEEWWREGP
jgi:ABC-type transport system substrate-binding protein